MITVLMATYNGSQFIEKQLDSIRNQTLKIDRVVIIDDMSTDGTYKLLLEYISQYNLTTWELYQNETNVGHYETFIRLVKKVHNGWVFFSDQDDIWNRDKVEKMSRVLTQSDVAMVFSQSQMIDDEDKVISSISVTNTKYPYPIKMLLQKWPSGYQSAYKVEILKEILDRGFHCYPYFQFHDVLFGMLVAIWGKVIKIDFILDSHRLHQNNVTLTSTAVSFNKTRQERLDYYEKMYYRYGFVSEIAKKYERFDIMEIADIYKKLYYSRKKFITSGSLFSLMKILKRYSYYNGINAFIGDLIYALRLNTICYKIIRRYYEKHL